ncbi:hypothetical protein F5887DRAFT_1136152 [Amanita rubescens]|nr:hypothetical protein F5887DRAFT_1136152 [Amanita rubescens]
MLDSYTFPASPPPSPFASSDSDWAMGLSSLPYDLLLNVATYLDLHDILALHLTCKSLHDFASTRPVYRKLAHDLLGRCRALPLKGFQRLSDLSTDQLIRAVNKASRLEIAWRRRAPRPIQSRDALSELIDDHYHGPGSSGNPCSGKARRKWYKVVSAPPNEEVDWLSPITSKYTLCATKSGKVVCWDVKTDTCIAEWCPPERWELWKCRVEFDQRTVFFTMAKVIQGSYDDDRVMEFVLMKLEFFDGPLSALARPPLFSRISAFKTAGVVMNVFLLDPSQRLLSAFVWLSSSNTIGLYVLLDWEKAEYVFIDTGIEGVMSSNWSCILFEKNIVIHCEESSSAFQHFYPIPILEQLFAQAPLFALIPPGQNPQLFVQPALEQGAPLPAQLAGNIGLPAASAAQLTNVGPVVQADAADLGNLQTSDVDLPNFLAEDSDDEDDNDGDPSQGSEQGDSFPNPFPFPWYPESAHFVRQWWPTLPGVPRVSCTVVLLAAHDPQTHATRFVLAQHYFRVPLDWKGWRESQQMAVKSTHEVHRSLTPPSNGTIHEDSGEGPSSPPSWADGCQHTSDTYDTDYDLSEEDEAECECGWAGDQYDNMSEEDDNDNSMKMWYVATPFDVVCVSDVDEEEDGQPVERPRPLIAVDFGHAVWIEHGETPRANNDPKRLRFVTFPPYDASSPGPSPGEGKMEGVVQTLKVPDELDLDIVETINIDQSQGAVILSVKDGKIFILCYE